MKVCQQCSFEFSAPDWRCPACDFVPASVDGLYAFAPEMALQHIGFPEDAFQELIKLESGNFWFRSRNKLIVAALKKYFPDVRSFLEIGCGTGFVLGGIEGSFPGLSLFGSEIATAGLVKAKGRLGKAVLFQMDARRIPFVDEYDAVGAFDVLEHIVEDTDVLRQIFKALRPGGGVLITVPQHPFLWSPNDEYAEHVRRYTSRELRQKMDSAGFRVIRMTSFVSLLLPMMIASRYWKKFSDQEIDPSTDMKISPPLNWLLERVLDVERSLIAAGLSFPAGGSLLAVAVKP